MTLTITLPEADVQALETKARAEGLSAEQYAQQVLARDLAPAWLRQSWATADQEGLGSLTMDEIEAEIAVARRARGAAGQSSGA